MPFRGSLQDIRLFVAAYEERSFTAAAAREYGTQSGVSHHVRNLETLLRVRLFNRDQAKITPTPAAEAFYRHCVGLLRSLDAATNEVARFSQGYQGFLRVGILPALTHHIIAKVLLKFSKVHPNVKVEVIESFSSSLGSLVAAGTIDFAIGVHATDTPGVHATSLLATPECLITRYDQSVKWSNLTDFASASPHNMVWATGFRSRRRSIEASLVANGISIGSVLEIDSSLATLDLVRRSDWKTVAPALVMDPAVDSDLFNVIPIGNPEVMLNVALIQPTTTVLSEEGSALVQMIVEEAEKNNSLWAERFRERKAQSSHT